MQRTLLFLTILLVALSLVSAKSLDRVERVVQASATTTTVREGADDGDDMKIINCCIMKYAECEAGYCDKIQKDQKALYDSINADKVDYTNPTGDIDMAELAKMHEMADLHQRRTAAASFLETGATDTVQVKAKEGVHLPYVNAHPGPVIQYKYQAADGTDCPKKISGPVKYLFASAVKTFHKGTCLRWQENAAATLVIGASTGGSYANALGTGATHLCINTVAGNGHLQLDTLLHEMGHVSGFHHTHKRSDVATFITFNDADIKKYAQWGCGLTLADDYPATNYADAAFASNCMVGWRYQFKKDATWDAATADVAGSKYDYKSIMHYPFSVAAGGVFGNLQMMTPDVNKYAAAKRANNNADIAPGTYGLTAEDLDAINKLYGCIQLTVEGKRGATPLAATKKVWVGKTHANDMLKHIVEEATGLEEATVVLKKSDGTVIGGTMAASNVADGATIKAEVP